MSLASKLFKGDRVIWIIFMFLCLISAVEVFSATSTLAYQKREPLGTYWSSCDLFGRWFLGCCALAQCPVHRFPGRHFAFPGLAHYADRYPFYRY